jgi:flagellar motor switch protein FliN/FliY
MSNILEELQAPVWTSVTRSVTDSLGTTAAFSPDGWSAETGEAVLAELAKPGMVATFRLPLDAGSGGAVQFPDSAIAALGADTVQQALEAAVAGACLGIGLSQPSPISASGVAVQAAGGDIPEWLAGSPTFARIASTFVTDSGSGTAVLFLNEAAVAAISGEPSPSTRPVADPGGAAPDLGLLMDVPLELSVELGRVRIPVRNVVELSSGSIVEIDKAAGEPVEVLLNGHLVARGEVVVIDENFGVRITELLKAGEAAREAA